MGKITFELRPEEFVKRGIKVKETPDFKAVMQEGAWCVVRREEEGRKVQWGEEHEITLAR